MFKRDKPLFSRPVLAVIIVVTTLAVWLLNLTSTRVNLATPNIETWQTASGIPVYWLTQDDWEGSDKLSLAIVFNSNAQSPQLTAATLSLLTGPTLPLSTATINQRLTPIAAAAETRYSVSQQQISVSLSNRPQFLTATLNVLSAWLNKTQFKEAALQSWQRHQRNDIGQQQLMLQLFPNSALATPSSVQQITVKQLAQHFGFIKQQVSHIVITGALNDNTIEPLQQGLNALTQSMQQGSANSDRQLATAASSSEIGDQSLSAVYGALGIAPITSVTDWLTLQVWAKDSLQAQKKRFNSQTGQWQLHLESPQAFVNWQIETPQSVLLADPASSQSHTSWIAPDQLPSYQEQAAFNALKDQLLQQLPALSQNPDWWRAIATSVAMPKSPLSLNDFAQHYSEAANSFTIEQYRQHLEQLLIPSSRQEVLIKL
ncbi:hypothetical protein [Marinomonas gallaica]|uniref:hypothetical protein n=1 Tax=Marinomonas gallaica TaxID=1806667 RepID=UPI003A8F2764